MIQQLGWLDPFEVAGSLRTRAGLFGAADEYGRRTLSIRLPRKDGDGFGFAKAAGVGSGKWPEMAILMDEMKRMGNGAVYLGIVTALWLDAGAVPAWEGLVVSDFSLAVMPLRVNPASIVYGGPVAAHLPAGSVSLVERRLPWCIANHGQTPTVHLMIDFRMSDA